MEHMLANSLENIPRAGYWLTDPKGIIIRSRGQALALSGLTPQQVEGTSVLDKVDRDGVETYRWGEESARLHRAALNRASGMEHTHNGGREFWQVWGPIYDDETREPTGIAVVYFDVTGMRDTELTSVIKELTVLLPDLQELAREKAEALRQRNAAAEAALNGRSRWQEWVTTSASSAVAWSGANLKGVFWALGMVFVLSFAAWMGVDIASLFKFIQPVP